MKWVLVLFLLIFLSAIALLVFTNPVQQKQPDIDEELGVFLYFIGSNSQECYLIFAGEKKPIKAPADLTAFRYDPQIEKPSVKIWMEGDTVKKAELWFKDKDQLREYLK